jgi:hypothetical protein
MGETVAIVAVATSAGVSLGTLWAAAARERAQRRWQAQEERTRDLRTVLEHAADELGKAMFLANEGLAEVEANGHLAPARRTHLMNAQRVLVLADLQIKLRSGEVREAFFRCVGTFLLMKGILDQAGEPQRDAAWQATFSNAQADAATNERAYFDAAAKALAAPTGRKRQ